MSYLTKSLDSLNTPTVESLGCDSVLPEAQVDNMDNNIKNEMKEEVAKTCEGVKTEVKIEVKGEII